MAPDAKNALEKLMNKVEFGIFQTGGESYELVQILYVIIIKSIMQICD